MCIRDSIEMDVIGWGDWDQRRNVIVNTNEPYDIIFGNMNTYNNDVQLGAYLDITDLLDTAAPELKAMLPEGYWDACRVNGRIYGVPTYKDSSMSVSYTHLRSGEPNARKIMPRPKPTTTTVA